MALKQKSQAAMEFLLTYGWAIIIIIVLVSALAYHGVLDMNRFLPRHCILEAGLYCQDFKIYSNGQAGEDGITLFIKNSRGKTLVIKSIRIDKYNCLQDMQLEKYGIIGNGESLKFPVYKCNFNGEKAIVSDITFTFLNPDTGLEYTETGSIRGNAVSEEFPLSIYDDYEGNYKLCARASYFDFCETLGQVWCEDLGNCDPEQKVGMECCSGKYENDFCC